jgi:hypothetical protein
MAQFSRRTILAATDVLGAQGHTEITRFLLEQGLEDAIAGRSRADRANGVARLLIQNPNQRNDLGENLSDAVVTAMVANAISSSFGGYPNAFQLDRFKERFPGLYRGLERDGFVVDGGQLRRALPVALDLPQADDEVHARLDHYGFAVSKGHLDQGITAHARGDWAAANAQFRPFIENLFDCIAERIAAGTELPAAGHQRRQWLSKTNPPFFSAELNEWSGDGKGFLEGFFRRLHPAGAHPGLSDEEDSTFRLHLVLLVSRLVLRRLNG